MASFGSTPPVSMHPQQVHVLWSHFYTIHCQMCLISINKTTIFQFSCSDCGVCVHLCLHWGTSVPVEQQCSCVYVFLSLPQVVWSELNNQAQLRASSVNSVTMPFMPEICKESKQHTLARSQYASVLHRSALKAHCGVVIKRCNCQCTCKQGFLTGLWRPMIRWVY